MKKFVLCLFCLSAPALVHAQGLGPKDFSTVSSVKEMRQDLREAMRLLGRISKRLDELETKVDRGACGSSVAVPPGKPDGEGWRYDAERGCWWRYVSTPSIYQAPAPVYRSSSAPIYVNPAPAPVYRSYQAPIYANPAPVVRTHVWAAPQYYPAPRFQASPYYRPAPRFFAAPATRGGSC